MADISKINVNSTDYNLKDADARALIGYVTEIPSGASIDDYTTTGTYHCASAADATCSAWNGSQKPITAYIFSLNSFYLNVIKNPNDYPVQILYPSTTDPEHVYFCVRWYAVNTGFTDWFTFPDLNGVIQTFTSFLAAFYKINNDTTITLGPTSYTPIAFAQCDTAANVKDKVASIVGNSTWTLGVGSMVLVKFANTNTYSATASNHITLNINGTGAKDIYYGASNANTGTNTVPYGYKNYVTFYVYDGTYWVFAGRSIDANTTYSSMTEAEITAATGTTARLITPERLLLAIKTWVFDSATLITSGADLNDYVTNGTYRASTTQVASGTLNRPAYTSPSSKTFRLEVSSASSNTDRQMQKLYVVEINTGGIEEFVRAHVSSGWGPWYQVTMSAVADYAPT